MMQQAIDRLLEEMDQKTKMLVQLFEQSDPEPEEMIHVFDKRGELIEELQSILPEGYVLSLSQRQQLENMQELNLQMLPKMEQLKYDFKKKLDDIRQKKAAAQFYNSGGTTAYGAFFDKKN